MQQKTVSQLVLLIPIGDVLGDVFAQINLPLKYGDLLTLTATKN